MLVDHVSHLVGLASMKTKNTPAQPRPSRACRKMRLKKGKGFFAWPQGKEPDYNSLRYYTRSLNFQQPHHITQLHFLPDFIS